MADSRDTKRPRVEKAKAYPGHGLALNETIGAYPTALGDHKRPLTTLREFTMMQFMNAITDKPNWHMKVFILEIIEKWKKEALESPIDITERMIIFSILELLDKAKDLKAFGYTVVYDGNVVKSDTAVSPETAASLREAVKKLEDVPEKHRDWHPNSDKKVLDLVHPSLFPLVYGRSRILDKEVSLAECLEYAGVGEVIPVPPGNYGGSNEYSTKFQWLPCNVKLEDGKPKITSYINNLHPVHHQPLYPLIETLIDASIPLWNSTLAPSGGSELRIAYHQIDFETDIEDIDRGHPDAPVPGGDEDDEEDENDYWERFEKWRWDMAGLILPEPEAVVRKSERSKHENRDNVDLKREYKGLQVIVKLANIVLAPESPSYEGGTWHVEGQRNENIVATALYYYDSENLTESRLAFRQNSDFEEAIQEACISIHHPQSQYQWLTDVYGLKDSGTGGLQEIGDVVCSQGRLITFPNTLQHRVKPFTLIDPTKPGHRKIVALFLVDPDIEVINTAIVPPQQQEWWAERANGELGPLNLPQGLQDEIIKNTEGEWPMGLEEAKELRLELMEERRGFVGEHNERMEEAEFGLCEH